MTADLCDVPSDGHDGPVHPYPGGRLCTAHAPQSRPRVEPTTSPARQSTTPRPVDPVGPVITGGLFIDMGQQLKNGTWVRPPRARYECLPCRWVSPEATGAAAVAQCIATAQATHHNTKHTATTQGARAA